MPSFGEELRRERELRSISLREIADATKVNLRYLEAIERNQFEALPGGVFNRGFVRAYAEFIGVDPDAMVNAYLLEEQAKTATSSRDRPELLRGERERRGPKRPQEKIASAPAETQACKKPLGRRRAPWIALLVIAAAAALLASAWAFGWLDVGRFMGIGR